MNKNMNKSMSKTSLRTLAPSIALATILAAGASLVWIVSFGWCFSVVTQLIAQQEPSEQLTFTQDGQPLVQSTTFSPSYATVYRTLNGEPITNLDKYELQSGSSWLAGPHTATGDRSTWTSRIIGFVEPGGVPHYWYLINDGEPQGHAYLQGFDIPTKRPIGYLGQTGFHAAPPEPAEQFEIETRLINFGLTAGEWGTNAQEPQGRPSGTRPVLFMVSKQSLFRLDLRHRSIAKLDVGGNVMAVGNIEELVPVPGEPRALEKPRVAVRLPERVAVVNDAGKSIRSIELPEAVRNRNLAVYLTTGPESIVVALADRHHALTEIFWLGPNSQVARHEQALLRGGFFDYGGMEPAWQVAAAFPVPVVAAVAYTVVQPQMGVSNGRFADSRSAVAASWAAAWPFYLTLCILSAVLAAVCYRHHVRYAQRGAMAWALFVLLTGPAGLIGYWLHRNWPVLDVCRDCGATVPRDREFCATCRTEFLAPTPRGIEIFA